MSNKYCLCYVTKMENREQGMSLGSGKMKNGNKTELEMKLPIGLGFKLGFFPIFHFSGFSLRIQEAGERCNIRGESFERGFTSE